MKKVYWKTLGFLECLIDDYSYEQIHSAAGDYKYFEYIKAK